MYTYRIFVDESDNVTFSFKIRNSASLTSMGFDCIKRHNNGDRPVLCWLCPKGTYGAGDNKQKGCKLCPAGMKTTPLCFPGY